MPPYKKKGNDGKGPCKFYQQGKCSNKRCPFLHVKGTSGKVIEDSGASKILSTMLKLFFQKQSGSIYFAETGLLNLSGLSSFEDFVGISSSLNFNTKTFCSVLCNCIKDVFVPPPTIYQFDNNGMKTILHLTEALEQAGLHQGIQAMSFRHNSICAVDMVAHLKLFTQLREINFEGNPVTEHPDYRQSLKKNIPSLSSIDRVAARAPPLALPWPTFYVPLSSSEPPADIFTVRRYTSLQSNIIQFIQTAVIGPMEGTGNINAISDVYSVSAILTLAFENNAVISTSPSQKSVERDVIRDIVAVRLRQTDANHNLFLGTKGKVVSSGRINVCSTLVQCVYPPNFTVAHFVHPSVDVSVLDGITVSVVTLHGVMSWTYTPEVTNVASNVVIQRNFSRTLSVSTGESGRWHIVNDLLSFHPYHDSNSTANLSAFSDILYTPNQDSRLVMRFSSLFNVPVPIVATLALSCSSDAQLASVLIDLSDVPMWQFEHAAALVNGDAVGSILLCRMHKLYGVDEQRGIALLQQYGLNWDALQHALGS